MRLLNILTCDPKNAQGRPWFFYSASHPNDTLLASPTLKKKTNKQNGGWGEGTSLGFLRKKTKLLLTRQKIKINVYKICPFHCLFFFFFKCKNNAADWKSRHVGTRVSGMPSDFSSSQHRPWRHLSECHCSWRPRPFFPTVRVCCYVSVSLTATCSGELVQASRPSLPVYCCCCCSFWCD